MFVERDRLFISTGGGPVKIPVAVMCKIVIGALFVHIAENRQDHSVWGHLLGSMRGHIHVRCVEPAYTSLFWHMASAMKL